METQEPKRPAQGQTAEVDDDGQGASSTADAFALIEAPDTVSAASIAIADERLPGEGPAHELEEPVALPPHCDGGARDGSRTFRAWRGGNRLLGPVEESRRALDADEDKIAFVQASADLLGDGLPDALF